MPDTICEDCGGTFQVDLDNHNYAMSPPDKCPECRRDNT